MISTYYVNKTHELFFEEPEDAMAFGWWVEEHFPDSFFENENLADMYVSILPKISDEQAQYLFDRWDFETERLQASEKGEE